MGNKWRQTRHEHKHMGRGTPTGTAGDKQPAWSVWEPATSRHQQAVGSQSIGKPKLQPVAWVHKGMAIQPKFPLSIEGNNEGEHWLRTVVLWFLLFVCCFVVFFFPWCSSCLFSFDCHYINTLLEEKGTVFNSVNVKCMSYLMEIFFFCLSSINSFNWGNFGILSICY